MTPRICAICRLPETYPGLSLDEHSICSQCRCPPAAVKPYAGTEALNARITSVLGQSRNVRRPYDAAVAFSGGRDSTYLLYYAKRVLGLNVLAITLTHRFMPHETSRSIEHICGVLGVDLHVIENHALNQCSTQCVQAWGRKPEAAALVTFCTGCRYSIKRLIPEFCKKQGIPLLLTGNTRMEQMTYRQDLLSINPQHPTTLNKAAGYLRSLLQNPGLTGNTRCACIQAYEFSFPTVRKLFPNRHVAVLAPFRDYVEVSGDELNAALLEIGWRHDACFKSEWRADCYINILRQYFYQKMLGFNDLDVYYADLLRSHKIDLETVMNRHAAENQFDETFIAELLRTCYDLDLQSILAKMPIRQPQ